MITLAIYEQNKINLRTDDYFTNYQLSRLETQYFLISSGFINEVRCAQFNSDREMPPPRPLGSMPYAPDRLIFDRAARCIWLRADFFCIKSSTLALAEKLL